MCDMDVHLVIFVWRLFVLVLSIAAVHAASVEAFRGKTPTKLQPFNKNRMETIVGVYKNQTKSKELGLSRAALVIIVTEKELTKVMYKEIILTLLSELQGLQMKSILFVDSNVFPAVKVDEEFFVSLEKKYPNTVVSDMRTSRTLPRNGTRFNKFTPALLSAVTLLDNIISYADAIVIPSNSLIVRDFVPSIASAALINNNCSMLVLPKVKNCEFPHLLLDFPVNSVEVAEGIMYMKSNSHSKLFLKRWAHALSSNKASSESFLDVVRAIDGAVVAHPLDAHDSSRLFVSFLSEFQFQSESVLSTCLGIQAYKRGVLAEFDINEYPSRKLAVPYLIVDVNNPHTSILKLFIDKSAGKFQVKTDAMNRYIHISVSDEIPDRLNILQKVEQGSLVALFGQSHIFVYDNNRIRMFPSGEALLSNGFRWHDVKKYDVNVISHFLHGPDVKLQDNIARNAPFQVHSPRLHVKHHKKDNQPTADEKLEEMQAMWKKLANATFDPHRMDHVKKVLGRAAGIYENVKMKNQTEELKKTVLIHVVSVPEDFGSDSRYFHMLSNWLCYSKQYNLNPITVFVPNSNTSTDIPPKALLQLGIKESNMLSYPLHLFWKLVAAKETNIFGNQASYEGDVPSFSNHGALVMLVPLLEALHAGFNVMYFDLDTMMIHDPVPFMMKGNADFTVQLELRNCFYPSSIYFSTVYDIINWEFLEPNTGIFFVRSTSKGIKLFEQWLAEVVRRNVMNDQKALEFRHLGAKISYSCNEELLYLQNNKTFMSQFRHDSKKDAPTFCFLNEFLFQNGKIALGCGQGNGGSKSEYLEDMYRQGVREFNGTLTVNVPPEQRDPFFPLPVLNTPVMIHFNYCDDKITEYNRFSGWLEKVENNVTTCDVFDVTKSSLGMDWMQQLRVANLDLQTAKGKFVNGSALRLHRRRSTYLYMNGELREIPDQETFSALGFTQQDVKSVGAYNFVRLIPVGESVPSARSGTV